MVDRIGGPFMSSAWDTDAVPSGLRRHVDSGPRRIHVVVADDLPGCLGILEELARFEDTVEVVGQATSTAGAVELIAAVEPDLVIMNVAVPSGDSLTLSRVIYTCLPHVTIVMTSIANSPRLRATCLTSGAEAFIHKPDFQREFGRILTSKFS